MHHKVQIMKLIYKRHYIWVKYRLAHKKVYLFLRILYPNHMIIKLKEKAGAELGQAQFKLELEFFQIFFKFGLNLVL